jgi:6-phospho-beta-glucosidase
MANPIRLTVLGGSGVATPELIDCLAQAAHRPEFHVSLVGRSRDKLTQVGAVCASLAKWADPPITISTHTNIREGLEGADYVLNQVRVGGYPARAFDETFPREFGVLGEETVGPGGFANALRTVPVVLEQCRAIEEVAPGALVVNLTNPSSYIQYAISTYTELDVLGLCDAPVSQVQMVASLMGVLPDELTIRYSGMHHFGWITSVYYRGRDIMPQVLEKISLQPSLPVEPEILLALKAIPSSYFKYFYHPDRMLANQQGKPARAEQLMALEAEMLAAYQAGEEVGKPPSLEKRGANWYRQIIIPVLMAHLNDSADVFILNVTNHGALPFLPGQAIVEVPCVVRRSGFLPLAYDGGLPPDLEAKLLVNATFEMLWVDATVERSYPKALRAMLLNHLVNGYDQAKALLDKIWY